MKVFYSWQSDLPNPTNRGMILVALEGAAKRIRDDDSIEVEPVIDRDTSGVPGSPDISSTIFAKVDDAAAFVCDVSIINSSEKSRPCPNPNVLIELGWALKTLTADRVILVMNTFFGKPEDLPFDLRMRRVIAYESRPDDSERAPARKKLSEQLERALRAIIENKLVPLGALVIPASPSFRARNALSTNAPNQARLTRDYMRWLVEQLDAMAPNLSGEQVDENLVTALDATTPLLAEFASVAEDIATMNAVEAAHALYKGFEGIAERYDLPAGGGTYWPHQFDYWKFLGHEMLVMYALILMREGRWRLLGDVLTDDLIIANAPPYKIEGPVPFEYLSAGVRLLNARNQRLRLNRASVHADLLRSRHTTAPLEATTPHSEFMGADYLLFLRGALRPNKEPSFPPWQAWSTIFIAEGTPRLLTEARSEKFTREKLLPAVGLDSLDVLRDRFEKRRGLITKLFSNQILFSPAEMFKAEDLGSR